ncbi:MAG: rhomboid family intramembrane serine protease [Candidatus ainarchaeum sp.]|nr:rhomboid family intramembrane serine protease [Candidatus ainarchaeum sp.]
MAVNRVFSFLFRIKATLIIFFLIVGIFFLFSNNFYIPQETIQSGSFSLFQPLNIIVYEFIHIGPNHLASNALTLLAFGIAFELALSSLDTFVLFFSSAILTALVFVFTNPGSSVVGASAGILSLITGSFFASPKKFFMALGASIIFALLIFAALNTALFSTQQSLETKEQTLNTSLQQAIAEKNLEKQRQIQEQIVETASQKYSFEQGKSTEKNAVSDYGSHVFAALFGIGYVFFFRRKKFLESMEQIDLFLHNIKMKIKKA